MILLILSFATPVGLILYGAKQMPEENLTTFGKKIKLPKGGLGIFGKLISSRSAIFCPESVL